LLLLKSIRNISMDTTTLDLLEKAGAIPALIPYLDSSQPYNVNEALLSLYYLCQIKSSRQEQAALSGIIPHLQRFISTRHPLNQFAYEIVFQLGKTSTKTRSELKKHGGLQFYIDLLKERYWRTKAFEVLTVWMSEDSDKVSFILNTPDNINKLLDLLRTTDVGLFEILTLFDKLLENSDALKASLATNKHLYAVIVASLHRYKSQNKIRVNLLKILRSVVMDTESPQQLLDEHKLRSVLTELGRDTSSVLVMRLAVGILQDPKANGSRMTKQIDVLAEAARRAKAVQAKAAADRKDNYKTM